MTGKSHKDLAIDILASAIEAEDPHAELLKGLIHAVLSLDEKPETRKEKPHPGEMYASAARADRRCFVFARSRYEYVESGIAISTSMRPVLILPTTEEIRLRGLRIQPDDKIVGINMSEGEVRAALNSEKIRMLWVDEEHLPTIELWALPPYTR